MSYKGRLIKNCCSQSLAVGKEVFNCEFCSLRSIDDAVSAFSIALKHRKSDDLKITEPNYRNFIEIARLPEEVWKRSRQYI